MPQGKGKASSSRRRSSDGHPYDDRPRLSRPSPSPPYSSSAPSSSFDTSIPLNLPPRRSMKMLKDGSDFVWPDSAHALFVRGLQAWKFLNIGNKRTRAPRGEGKTDFLVRFLQSHGVERTKKQVASHLQVLRTEWRNSDNTLLLSLVDDTVSHTRSLSEPSQPPSSTSSPSTSLSFFNPSFDRVDDRAISTPSLPPPISSLPPQHLASTSSLFHPAHDIYGARQQSYPETSPDEAFHTPPSSTVGSWQVDDTIWTTAVDRFPSQQTEPEPYARPPLHYPVASYDPPSSFHDYDRTPRPLVPTSLESRGFSSDYYNVPGLHNRGDPSSSVASLPRSSHSLSLETENHPNRPTMISASSYDSYNTLPSYTIPQPAPQDVYGNASTSYGNEPYQTHYSGEPQPQHSTPPHAAPGIVGSASYDVVEPDFLPSAHPQPVQPQWLRPPATFLRQPDTPERHDGSPEP